MSAMERCWILGHLLFLSAEDIKERQLSLWVIGELGVTGLFCKVAAGEAPRFFLGFLLLTVGYLGKEQIGYGDGWLILALEMWLSVPELLYLLFLGIGMGTLYGFCFRIREVPLVPFLTAAYLIGVWQ